MEAIKGKEKCIRTLLENTRFSIDFYQREYKWRTKQLQELINDLTEKFLVDFDKNDDRSEIQNYKNYFLGSIILCEKEGKKFIIDGQQRLTTITLILIYLRNRILDEDQKNIISSLIYSQVYGKRSFNIDVDERRDCMDNLYHKNTYDITNAAESVQNIVERFGEIEMFFPEDFDEVTLIYFSDWLLQNVYLVEITAFSDEDAYTIFETMNDRGLSLNPLDMLKGYLLACITNSDDRKKAVAIWKNWSEKLRALGKDEDSDAFKSWLRSKYAETIRERKRGATAQDFDKIGTEFHRWLKDNSDKVKLESSKDFFNFIDKELQFYIREFINLKKVSQELTAGLEPIFYNSKIGFTLQYPLLLAPLVLADTEDIIKKKYFIVSAYLDSLIARRIWNNKSIAYSTMQYAMFNTMKEIRGKSINELVALLSSKLIAEPVNFSSNDRLRLHQQNRFFIHHMLARITSYVETSSGMSNHFKEYIAEGKNRYEIEHIWANHPERFTAEFTHPNDFLDYRNRIGGLLLLPKSFNGSYSDSTYSEKLPHYFGQNLLAKSLHSNCYEHNPGFLRFKQDSNLPFQFYDDFKKNNLDERYELYRKLAELIWSPERILREVE